LKQFKIPKELEIGCYTYKIELDKGHLNELRARGRNGECLYEDQLIRIDVNSTKQSLNHTFLHELLHAIDINYNSKEEEYGLDERQIDVIATGLQQIFKQIGIEFCIKEENIEKTSG
jgi:hypothetical protein